MQELAAVQQVLYATPCLQHSPQGDVRPALRSWCSKATMFDKPIQRRVLVTAYITDAALHNPPCHICLLDAAAAASAVAAAAGVGTDLQDPLAG